MDKRQKVIAIGGLTMRIRGWALTDAEVDEIVDGVREIMDAPEGEPEAPKRREKRGKNRQEQGGENRGIFESAEE